MANYRNVHTRFWSDPDVESLSPSARYLFLYLFTNPHRNESCLYSFSPAKMAFETALPIETVMASLVELSDSNRVRYDAEFGVVWVMNAVKHQSLNPQCIRSIEKDLDRCNSEKLRAEFWEHYKTHKIAKSRPIPDPYQTHTQPIGDPSIGIGIGLGIGLGVEGKDSQIRETTTASSGEVTYGDEPASGGGMAVMIETELVHGWNEILKQQPRISPGVDFRRAIDKRTKDGWDVEKIKTTIRNFANVRGRPDCQEKWKRMSLADFLMWDAEKFLELNSSLKLVGCKTTLPTGGQTEIQREMAERIAAKRRQLTAN